MNIAHWFFFLITSSTSNAVRVGTRVRTPHGIGTITNGSVQVDLDQGQPMRPNANYRVNVTSNIQDIKVI